MSDFEPSTCACGILTAGDPGNCRHVQNDVPAGWHLVLGGTFALYAGESGDMAMVTDVEGRGREQRRIPKAMVEIFQGKGPLGKMAAKMFGGLGPAEEAE